MRHEKRDLNRLEVFGPASMKVVVDGSGRVKVVSCRGFELPDPGEPLGLGSEHKRREVSGAGTLRSLTLRDRVAISAARVMPVINLAAWLMINHASGPNPYVNGPDADPLAAFFYRWGPKSTLDSFWLIGILANWASAEMFHSWVKSWVEGRRASLRRNKKK